MSDTHDHTTLRQLFQDYFDSPGLDLPEPLPASGELRGGGWLIRYIIGEDEAGETHLDFFAESRFTNSRHVRLTVSGETISLENYQPALIFTDEHDQDWGRASAAQHAHNEQVTAILQAKGLLGQEREP